MAQIRKLPSGRHQVQSRRPNLKTISKTFRLRKDALKWAVQIEADDELLEQKGSYNTQTLAGLIDKYQIYYDQLFDAGLVKDDHVTSRLAFWKDELGDVKLLDLNSDHIRAGIQTLIEDKNLKPQSSNRYKSTISKTIGWSIEQINTQTKQKLFIIKDNPCRGIRSKKEGKGRERTFRIHNGQQGK